MSRRDDTPFSGLPPDAQAAFLTTLGGASYRVDSSGSVYTSPAAVGLPSAVPLYAAGPDPLHAAHMRAALQRVTGHDDAVYRPIIPPTSGATMPKIATPAPWGAYNATATAGLRTPSAESFRRAGVPLSVVPAGMMGGAIDWGSLYGMAPVPESMGGAFGMAPAPRGMGGMYGTATTAAPAAPDHLRELEPLGRPTSPPVAGGAGGRREEDPTSPTGTGSARGTHSRGPLGVAVALSSERWAPRAVAAPAYPPFGMVSYRDLVFSAERQLGEGYFGVVRKARWGEHEVAVKELTAPLSGETAGEFSEEALQLAALKHPNIVKLLAVCLESPHYCMVMELMPKGSLRNVLNSREDLSWDLRIRMAEEIAAGMAYLHGKGVIHRDLKSYNVLVDLDFHVKVSDFGLAKVKPEDASGITACGTIRWQAPELFTGRSATKESDVYALGLTLWELASREVPFRDASIGELVARVLGGEREPIPAETPPKMAHLIARCWAQRAEERPTAQEVLHELQRDEPAPAGGGAAAAARR